MELEESTHSVSFCGGHTFKEEYFSLVLLQNATNMTVVLLMTDQMGLRSMIMRNVKRKERNRAENDWALSVL